MNRRQGIAVLVIVLAFLSYAHENFAHRDCSSWKIDRDLKFNLAYFLEPEPGFHTFGNVQEILPFKLTADSQSHEPDITNINLAAIRSLGFPLPARPFSDKYTFFLKFYVYPSFLNSKISASQWLKEFLVDRVGGASNIREFIKRNENVVIKKGLIKENYYPFTVRHPYPAFFLPTKKFQYQGQTFTPQEYFDQNIPFCSLYVCPGNTKESFGSDKEKVEASAGGVVALHEQILNVYKSNLTPVKGADQEKFYYFISQPVTSFERRNNAVIVHKIVCQPTIFKDNYRDLMMPQDPKRIFLSGLSLLSRATYIPRPGCTWNPSMIVDSPQFKLFFKQISSKVFEIGSVVRF